MIGLQHANPKFESACLVLSLLEMSLRFRRQVHLEGLLCGSTDFGNSLLSEEDEKRGWDEAQFNDSLLSQEDAEKIWDELRAQELISKESYVYDSQKVLNYMVTARKTPRIHRVYRTSPYWIVKWTRPGYTHFGLGAIRQGREVFYDPLGASNTARLGTIAERRFYDVF